MLPVVTNEESGLESLESSKLANTWRVFPGTGVNEKFDQYATPTTPLTALFNKELKESNLIGVLTKIILIKNNYFIIYSKQLFFLALIAGIPSFNCNRASGMRSSRSRF